MTPSNIVFVGNFLYPRGMAGTKRVQSFIDGVRTDSSVSASVLILRQGHPGRDDSCLDGEHDGVPYITIGADIRLDWRLPTALSRYFFRGAAWLRSRRISNGKNIVFLYGEPNIESLFFILYARFIGYRVVIDIVEDYYNVGQNASLASVIKGASSRLITSRLNWFADAVVVISSYLREKFERIGKNRLPVYTIPVSVNLERVRASSMPFHSPVRVFYAGSFAEKDGVEDLIRAFECVAEKYPNIELQLTGKGLPSRMECINALIGNSPAVDKIRYLGYLSDEEYFDRLGECDIACVVRTASAFADRGFPFKLGEYLGTGRPVIAAAVGDIPSYLLDRESALLVDAGSRCAIVSALEYALSEPEEALRIGRNGRSVAEMNFDAIENGRKLLDLLNCLDAD